jgi:hypothetical protein
MRDSGLERYAQRYGSDTAYPEVGVEFGEQFRRYEP